MEAKYTTTRITQYDRDRLEKRASSKKGSSVPKEITALLDLAEAFEKLGGDADLKTYRSFFTRPPKDKLAS
jgi:hypothetical protein